MNSAWTKALLLASTGALALVLVGCGSSNTASSSSDSSTDSSTSATTETAAPAQSNYAVTIDGATAGTDYKGNPCIIVTYTFTNNSDDATSFALAYNAEVYQNGVQCETAICQSIDSSSYMSKLQKGASIQAQLAYSTTDTSAVEVDVYELFSLSKTPVATQTFPLS